MNEAMQQALIGRDDVELCVELGWTDGLPVVPPTAERVQRMLGAAAGRRDAPGTAAFRSESVREMRAPIW